MRKVKLTVSPTGTYHRVHTHGASTFCGLDLSTSRRKSWNVWEGELSGNWLAHMCRRCMPDHPAGSSRGG